jgi:hypothetical protein
MRSRCAVAELSRNRYSGLRKFAQIHEFNQNYHFKIYGVGSTAKPGDTGIHRAGINMGGLQKENHGFQLQRVADKDGEVG